jgi:hypothetical protein
LVEISIGNGKILKTYLIHRNFATYDCPVFERAFNGKFIEADTQVYIISDFDFPDTFADVMHWMYTGDIFSVQGRIDGIAYDPSAVDFEKLCRLWVLADRLLIPELQDRAIDQLLRQDFEESATAKDSVPLAVWVYKKTSSGSPLRRLLTYKYAFGLDWKQGLTSFNLPIELISDIASVYQQNALKCYARSQELEVRINKNWGCDGCAEGGDCCGFSQKLCNPAPTFRGYQINKDANDEEW